MGKLEALFLKLSKGPLSTEECIWLVETCSALARNGYFLSRVITSQLANFEEVGEASLRKFPKES